MKQLSQYTITNYSLGRVNCNGSMQVSSSVVISTLAELLLNFTIILKL